MNLLDFFKSKGIFLGSIILPLLVLIKEYVFYLNNPETCGFKVLHTCSSFSEYLSGVYGIEAKGWILGTFVVSLAIIGILFFISNRKK